MAYIDIKNLNYWYAEASEKSVKDINMNIEKGEILFLIGKSGSGKSTLGKVISGAIPYFYGGKISGSVSIDGKLLKDMEHAERAREITMVFQDPERQLMMNKVHREIAFGLENIGVEENIIKRRIWEAMQFTNITELAYRDINTLSGGQKQKVAIAAALAYAPNCIILDEPTSQLDPASSEEVVELVRKINEELGITIIVIEQRSDKWFDIADKIAYLRNGLLDFYGSRELFYKYVDEKTRNFLPAYLRLASSMCMNVMPHSFKEMRRELNNYHISFTGSAEPDSVRNSCAIEISNMDCSYGNEKVLKNINICIEQGEFIGILGANGAGKSTLLKTVTGLNRYGGSVKVGGREVKRVKLQELSKSIGYVSQNPNDYISRDTVYDEIKFTLDNHGVKEYGLIDEVLKKLDIDGLKNRNPRDLSGGERQRVAIAAILVMKPEILILDEPTRGLDADIKASLGNTLRELNSKGTTVLLVTHDVEFASEFCRRFILMFNGEVCGEGTREQVLTTGIYYTSALNKLFRNINSNVFSLAQIVEMKKK